VAAAVSFACTAKQPTHTASTPAARPPVDSGVVLVTDSLVFRDMRRALVTLDSLARELRATPVGKAPHVAPFSDSLVFRDMNRLVAQLDSFVKQHRAMPIAKPPRTVFTDSALHFAVCELPKAGDDWRRVCVPKDQSVKVR
jgi:Fe-S-cluster formation regulator IscX/YfhJ